MTDTIEADDGWSLRYAGSAFRSGPVKYGAKVVTSNDDEYTVLTGRPPENGDQGRVYALEAGFFSDLEPSVVDLEWVRIVPGTGPVRPDAVAKDNCAGFHNIKREDLPRGVSIEVWWATPDEWEGGVDLGWYWWARLPGCEPDGFIRGPFHSSDLALIDAGTRHPDPRNPVSEAGMRFPSF